MARVLIVVPPLHGHVNPLVGVSAELVRRGHEVTWAGAPGIIRTAGGVGGVVPAGPDPDGPLAGRPAELRSYAALKHLWEQFLVPLAADMLPGVTAAVRATLPDIVVADQQALAGALVAHKYGVPLVTSASTSAELVTSWDRMPKIAAWIQGLQNELRAGAGLEPDGPDLRFSSRLILVFSTAALAGGEPDSRPVLFVGPSTGDRAAVEDCTELPTARPLVVVTMGTANAETTGQFLQAAADALSVLHPEVHGLIADPDQVVNDRPGVTTLARIPQLAAIEQASVVVCHGGHNTVCESLAAGVPLVVAPIRDDQPVIAEQVVRAGAGMRLRFDRTRAGDLVRTIRTVLDQPDYRIAARRMSAELAAAGGTTAAVDAVETVLRAENSSVSVPSAARLRSSCP